MTALKAGERVTLVGVIRFEYSADPEHYFDDIEGHTAADMAALDLESIQSGDFPVEELLAQADDVVTDVFAETED